MEYKEEKIKCEELCKQMYSAVDGHIDIKGLTYAIYPKIVNWETRKPLWKTVENWITGIWVKENWKQIKEDELSVVYGIISEGKLVYVGKTSRGLNVRKYEHETGDTEVSKYLNTHECEFVILGTASNDYEVSLMEKKIINVCKPLLNKEGKDVPYKFELTNEGKKIQFNKMKEIVDEIDDINEIIELYIMKEKVDLWKIEDAEIEGIHMEPIHIDFGIEEGEIRE
jgi:hypothetical protein